jgi:toxin ParE1/3/4
MYSIHVEAQEDLDEGASFYRQQAGTFLARSFLTEFERTIETILRFPRIGRQVDGIRRKFPLKRFPYSIIYRFDDQELYVLAVHHQSRRPDYWRHRR